MSRRNVEEMADDYGAISSGEFDAKYPGWAEDDAVLEALTAEFRRRRGDPDPLHIESDDPQPRPRGCAYSVLGWLVLVLALVQAPQGAPTAPVAQLVEHRPSAAVRTVGGRRFDSGSDGSALPGAPLGAPPSQPALAFAGSTVPSASVPALSYPASATWCAPRGNQCLGWGGSAELAAVHSFTFGDTPYWIRLRYQGKEAEALVVSHCQCGRTDAAIDVSPYVFRQLAPLSRGRIDVEVTVLGERPAVTAPPTDTEA